MSKPTALQVALAKGDWAQAEALLLTEATQGEPPAAVCYNLGKVLEAKGDYLASGPWFEKAIAADKQYAIAWFELGRWALAHHAYEKAMLAFAEASSLDPDDSDAQRNHARAALRCGEWETAEASWHSFDDLESQIARYRILVESGRDGVGELSALLARRDARAAIFDAMTRTAKGSIPLRVETLAATSG